MPQIHSIFFRLLRHQTDELYRKNLPNFSILIEGCPSLDNAFPVFESLIGMDHAMIHILCSLAMLEMREGLNRSGLSSSITELKISFGCPMNAKFSGKTNISPGIFGFYRQKDSASIQIEIYLIRGIHLNGSNFHFNNFNRLKSWLPLEKLLAILYQEHIDLISFDGSNLWIFPFS